MTLPSLCVYLSIHACMYTQILFPVGLARVVLEFILKNKNIHLIMAHPEPTSCTPNSVEGLAQAEAARHISFSASDTFVSSHNERENHFSIS